MQGARAGRRVARQWRRCRKKEVAGVVVDGGSGRKKKRKEEEEVKRGNDDVKKKGRKVGGREDRKEIERVGRIELYGTLIRGRNSEGTGTL